MTTQSSYRVQAVQDFIAAYNRYDIKAMVANLHPAVVFRNISHGKLTVETQGIDAFERQAEQGARLFRSRVQRIQSISIEDDRIEVEIDYHAILAVDLPNLKPVRL